MATGDIVFFNEAKAYMLDGGWEAADDIKVMVARNTVVPTASTAGPVYTTFTEVTTTANYVAGGTSIGTWGNLIAQAAGTVTFDSATNPSWAQHASGDANAYWGIAYNDTDGTKRALFFVELGGPVNMSTGSLTITWNVANGIATLI